MSALFIPYSAMEIYRELMAEKTETNEEVDENTK